MPGEGRAMGQQRSEDSGEMEVRGRPDCKRGGQGDQERGRRGTSRRLPARTDRLSACRGRDGSAAGATPETPAPTTTRATGADAGIARLPPLDRAAALKQLVALSVRMLDIGDARRLVSARVRNCNLITLSDRAPNCRLANRPVPPTKRTRTASTYPRFRHCRFARVAAGRAAHGPDDPRADQPTPRSRDARSAGVWRCAVSRTVTAQSSWLSQRRSHSRSPRV